MYNNKNQKAMTKMIAMFMAVLMNCLVGGTLAVAAGLSPMTGAVGMNVLAAIIGQAAPAGSLRAGVYTEIWTGELVKYLRRGLEATFLDGIPDSSSIVNNDVIHLVEVGVDPDVLINNTTYPIPLQALEDKDIAIKLDKFQTKVTPITDDELYALSYDKMARVKESHGNAISDSKFAKAAHALCAKEDTATTPVLKTTGKRDPVTGRLKMTPTDLLNLKRALDKLKVPAQGRRLVLCSDHANDLLEVSQVFKEQYNINRNDGTVGRLYGFDIYEFANNPLYTTAGKKKEVGASAATGEFQCSFAFYVSRVFKATGSTKMYYSEASTDPQNQRSLINFRHYFICMPKKTDAGAVMMSGYKDPSLPEG
nr:MAG TPA: Major capsid protein [Caudoviricetes sp.]